MNVPAVCPPAFIQPMVSRVPKAQKVNKHGSQSSLSKSESPQPLRHKLHAPAPKSHIPTRTRGSFHPRTMQSLPAPPASTKAALHHQSSSPLSCHLTSVQRERERESLHSPGLVLLLLVSQNVFALTAIFVNRQPLRVKTPDF